MYSPETISRINRGYWLVFISVMSSFIFLDLYRCKILRNLFCLFTLIFAFTLNQTYAKERFYHTIVVFHDESEDYFIELTRFMKLLPEEYRRDVLDGNSKKYNDLVDTQQGVNIVYFGLNKPNKHVSDNLPSALESFIEKTNFFDPSDPSNYSPIFRQFEKVEILCSFRGEFDENYGVRIDAALNPHNLQDCREEHYSLIARFAGNACNSIDCSTVFAD